MEIKIILVGIIVFIMISMVLNENQPCYQPLIFASRGFERFLLYGFWILTAILILMLLEMHLNEKAVQKCQKEK